MQKIVTQIQTYKKEIIIGILLLLVFISGTTNGFSQTKQSSHPQVLGASIHKQLEVSPTLTPFPTAVPVTIINNVIVPTSVPSPTSQAVTPTPIVILITPTPTPGISIIPTQSVPTQTPTPAIQTATVHIDYAGQQASSTYSVALTSNEHAWQVVQDAVGIAKLQYTDYGGSLGIFITGFNGINATANQYYEFRVNGVSSSTGVSSYLVQDHDVLDFVLTTF